MKKLVGRRSFNSLVKNISGQFLIHYNEQLKRLKEGVPSGEVSSSLDETISHCNMRVQTTVIRIEIISAINIFKRSNAAGYNSFPTELFATPAVSIDLLILLI